MFEDSSGDQKYQHGERVGQSDELTGLEQGGEYTIEIELPEVPEKSVLDGIVKLGKQLITNPEYREVLIGKIMPLDSPEFNNDNAELGLWQPLKFIKTVPFGLFFLSEYDEEKIPVLFVHGVSGHPAQFTTLIEGLDTEKYQPWIFFYPSGVPIDKVGEYLQWIVEQNRDKYGFEQVTVICHSMGGLVSRSFVNIQNKKGSSLLINPFISLSSPWGGHQAAEKGLKYAPGVIPVWKDMVPGSDFLSALHATSLPNDTKHYVLFGFRGKSSFAGGNSDGVISIASQLEGRIQENSTEIRGFDEDHVSILESEAVVDYIGTVLQEEIK